MTNSITIIGGGFNGICTAYLLAEKGYEVNLIDTGETIGGVMASVERDGYIYDLGCHLFDNCYKKQADLIKTLLDNRFTPHKAVYASITNGIKTHKIDNPNLASLDRNISATILFELIEAIISPQNMPVSSLFDKVRARFGATAAKALDQLFSKKTRCSFEALSSSVFDTILPPRLYFLESRMATFLKKHPDLDLYIAVDSMDDPLKFEREDARPEGDYRQFYPASRGMKGFCEEAEKKLSETGVNIYKSTFCTKIDHTLKGCLLSLEDKANHKTWQLTTDMVYWAGDVSGLSKILGAPEDMSVYNQPVPMILFYFNLPEDQIGHYSYMHNFDRDVLISRISAPSKYGADVAPKGMGYVCAELTTKMGSDLWENPEAFTDQVWNEIMEMGYISPSAKKTEPFVLKTPVGYMLKKKGYNKAFDSFREFTKDMRNIHYPDRGSFSKANIFADVENIIKKLPQSSD